MTEDNRRWLLRQSGPVSQPWVEVTKQHWLQAEHRAGFRGGGEHEPATSSFTSTTGLAGRIYYPAEALPEGTVALPEGTVELGAPPPEVSYEWGVRAVPLADMPGGNPIWESYTDEEGDAEDRARGLVERLNRGSHPREARLIRRRIETYQWEEVE